MPQSRNEGLFRIYLTERTRQRLSPKAKETIEAFAWLLLTEHHRGITRADADKPFWLFSSSENHYVNDRRRYSQTLQIVRMADRYGPDHKLGDESIESHHQAWTAFWIRYFEARSGQGTDMEIAHPNSYGLCTVGVYYDLYDFTDSPRLRELAGNFLTLYWAEVAAEFEPRTGQRALAATRNPFYDGVRTYWAESLLYCYGWHDGGYKNVSLGNLPFIFSSYRPPEIFRAIARDPKRGPYQTTSRRAVMIDGKRDQGVVVFDENGDSHFRRDVFYTPDYTFSTMTLDPLRTHQGTGDLAQTMGVNFASGPQDRVVVRDILNDPASKDRFLTIEPNESSSTSNHPNHDSERHEEYKTTGIGKRKTMKQIIFAMPFLVVAATVGIAAESADRPSIIVIMADDMGFSELGCYGGEIRTPTIDRLAEEGLRFSQFYNASICGPSRAALMTGCQPWNVGQTPGANIFANLTSNCATVLELLQANGYATCAVGRLDMVTGGNWHDPADIARGVDRFLGSASGGPGDYFREVAKTPWFRDGKRFQRPQGEYSTDLITDFVAGFIEGTAGSDKPFFLYVSHYAPHWPLQAKEEHVAPYLKLYRDQDIPSLMKARWKRLVDSGLVPSNTTLTPALLQPEEDIASREVPLERIAINAAMIESIDRSLASTMAALEKAGRAENTLILILSDNGASSQLVFNRPVPQGARPGGPGTFLNQGNVIASLGNTPFRGHKRKFYEGGIASPLIAWWPNGLKNAGRISHRLSHIADIMPTCLELAGVTYPETFRERQLVPLAGDSFVSTLRDEAENGENSRILPFAEALRQGDWKLVKPKGGRSELYNLAEDRNETTDLAGQFPDRVRNMEQLLRKLGP